jgi:hypothetical protein
MEEGDNWGNRLTHASMETTDVKPLMIDDIDAEASSNKLG